MLFISLIFIVFFQNTESLQNNICPFGQDKPVPYQTLSSINLNTKTAIPLNTSSPAITRDAVLAPLLIKNTGYAVEIFGNPEVFTTTSVYGGVACGKFYKFHKARFYFTRNPTGASYGQFNGVNTFLTVNIYYFKYSTFEESLHHRDGVINTITYYKMSKLPNWRFFPVAPVIRLLRKPGTAIYANAAFLYSWFIIIQEVTKYYAFYGSYEDLETGKQYQCTINIVGDGIFPLITNRQFEESFLTLDNINGSKLETVSPIYKKDKRNQVYSAKRVRAQFVPV